MRREILFLIDTLWKSAGVLLLHANVLSMWNDDYKGRSTLYTGQITYGFSANLAHVLIKVLHFCADSNEHDEQKFNKVKIFWRFLKKRHFGNDFYQCVFDKREVRSLS